MRYLLVVCVLGCEQIDEVGPPRFTVAPELTEVPDVSPGAMPPALRYGGDGVPIPDGPYFAWLARLSDADRAKVDKYCREHGGNYEATCGGIGPFHIPMPPREIPMPGEKGSPPGSFEKWSMALTAEQSEYFNWYCGDENRAYCDLCGATPLVLVRGGRAVEFNDGWPTAATPWLALDRNRDGAITPDELFGSATVLPDGTFAHDGFEALAALDANHDGRIDRDDPAFGSLVLWGDRNGDGKSSPDEVTPLDVESLSLSYTIESRCTQLACERERAPAGAGAELVDVHLRFR